MNIAKHYVDMYIHIKAGIRIPIEVYSLPRYIRDKDAFHFVNILDIRFSSKIIVKCTARYLIMHGI
jgi:hypothetical protein